MNSIDPRKQQVLDYICSKGFATPDELARQFHVSAITARRDIIWLEQEGLLKRIHGGAVPNSAPPAITHVSVRMRAASEAKRAIAMVAVELVTPGARIFLDAGSTCAYLAQELPIDMDLTVITHSLANIAVLAHKPRIQVISPGGELNVRLDAFIGTMTEHTLATFHADLAFIGAAGVDLEQGFTTDGLSEGQIKTLMARHAHEAIVLADSTKLGKMAFRSVLPLTAASQIITDADAPEHLCSELRQCGIKVVKAAFGHTSNGLAGA